MHVTRPQDKVLAFQGFIDWSLLMNPKPSLVECSQEKAWSLSAATAVDAAAAALAPTSWTAAAAGGAAVPLSLRAAGGLATAG